MNRVLLQIFLLLAVIPIMLVIGWGFLILGPIICFGFAMNAYRYNNEKELYFWLIIGVIAFIVSLFAGSFLAYAYFLIRYAFSYRPVSIAIFVAYIMIFVAFGRLVSFFYEGFNYFGLFVFLGELFLVIVLLLAHRKRKNEIPYF